MKLKKGEQTKQLSPKCAWLAFGAISDEALGTVDQDH